LIVCDEADAGCPTVRGAFLRRSMPFADPKSHDDTPEEAVQYAERRDDIGRLMLSVMTQVRDRPGRPESTH
jgi:arsenate reductase